MRIEPVPALEGHVAVPGDKSISHRAVLVGALCEGDVRVTGFGRSADTEATIAAVRALGVDVVEDDVDTLRVRGVGLRSRPALRESRLRKRGNAHAARRGHPRGQRDSSSSATIALGTADGAGRRAAPANGRSVETTDGHAPVSIEGVSSARSTTSSRCPLRR